MAGYTYRGPYPERPMDTAPAAERIIAAAINLYGDMGFTGVSLKTIAAQAGVSAPLISHYFGSKEGLRRACDRYASAIVDEFKTEALESGDRFAPEMIPAHPETQPILRYIIQSLIIGGPEINKLLDDFVDHSVAYAEEGVKKGLIRLFRFEGALRG